MPPPKHSYTKYITVLNEKANKFNYFALCCYCKAKITNTKRLVISHLKSCNKFEEQYSENERNRILFPERYEEIQEKDQTEGESSFSHEQNFSFPSSSLSHRSSFSFSSLSYRSSFSASSLSQHSHEFEISTEEESVNKKRKTKITYYMPRPTPLSKQEYTQWEDLVLNSTIDNGWSFRWVENQSSQKMINFANPGLKLPSRKVLAGRILNTNSEHIKKSLIDTAQKDELGVTVCFDGWKNVKKQEIMGSVLITSDGQVLVWGGEDISRNRVQWEEIKEFTLNFLSDLDKQNIKYNAVITDSASSNQAARKRLAPEWRDVFFGPCFAHQANLIVGEIFKESPNLINASEKAIQIITYLNRSVYFMARLRDEQKIKYNKYLALLLPCATRWILIIIAISVLISKYAPEEFDQEDEAIYHSGEEDKMRNNKTLPLDICKTIDNDIW
ncbi:unnamed protein product [Rhizophagus irregularis]|nr:unnamed protein product [Rhizophagus irregularis]CAB5380553.1 unnamed protein product [Rhizophagus irregularis]